MFRRLLFLLALAIPSGAAAEHTFADSIRVQVTFSRSFEGNYRPGEPYDVLTIAPDGTGETLAEIGVLVEVFAISPDNRPYVGIPANEIVLFKQDVALCSQFIEADGPTDANGYTTFTGTIAGGGCAPAFEVYVKGIYIAEVPVRTNSADFAGVSPFHVDAGDLAAFAERFGDPNRWDICSDFNESGPPTIDASDLASFAAYLGGSCLRVHRGSGSILPAPSAAPRVRR